MATYPAGPWAIAAKLRLTSLSASLKAGWLGSRAQAWPSGEVHTAARVIQGLAVVPTLPTATPAAPSNAKELGQAIEPAGLRDQVRPSDDVRNWTSPDIEQW